MWRVSCSTVRLIIEKKSTVACLNARCLMEIGCRKAQ